MNQPPKYQAGGVEERQPRRLHTNRRPVVTYTLLGITVLVFAFQFLSEQLFGYDLPLLMGAKINQAIMAGELWRLVTPVLLHGSLWHLGFNMYALFVLGPGIELYYGKLRFIFLYVLSGISGVVMSFYFSANPSLGASTAIFGLAAAQAVFIFRNREFFGGQARRMLVNILLVLAVNFMFGLAEGGIDNWGHLGGLLGGLAFAWLAGPLLAVRVSITGQEMVDVTPRLMTWALAGIELVVLFGLVFLRMFRAG